MSEFEAPGLYQLNRRIREQVLESFPEPLWVVAEISELSVNRNGHCYLELIEKEADGEKILARSRATIWSGIFRILKPYFETTTGQELAPGLKVMVKVTVEFHEVYSFSLNIRDIEPKFTLGEMAARRLQILRRLEETGTFGMNRELELPPVPQRIAIISSPTAAGYGDFINQLTGNAAGYVFYLKLFAAVMQGEETAPTILDALSRIEQASGHFDAVVIIRGGGSKFDLSSFDHFELGLAVTQFPLPVITGIGHEQDDTILDLVAHTRCKTPTAAAEFLIDRVERFESRIDELSSLTAEMAREIIESGTNKLSLIAEGLNLRVAAFTRERQQHLASTAQRTERSAISLLKWQGQQLAGYEQAARLHDPTRLLARGYSITYLNGKPVRSTAEVATGEHLTTRLADGELQSIVEQINNKKL
ncbi:MAG: exodeoxyribonuclease VII large subunit [Bacteroidales bacterium]